MKPGKPCLPWDPLLHKELLLYSGFLFPLVLAEINRIQQSVSLAHQIPDKKWGIGKAVFGISHDLVAILVTPISHTHHSWGMENIGQGSSSRRWCSDSQEKWLFWNSLWIFIWVEPIFSRGIHFIMICGRKIGHSCMILTLRDINFYLGGQVSRNLVWWEQCLYTFIFKWWYTNVLVLTTLCYFHLVQFTFLLYLSGLCRHLGLLS